MEDRVVAQGADTNVDKKMMANAIRALAMDAVQQANSVTLVRPWG